jgi:hypothetical protein
MVDKADWRLDQESPPENFLVELRTVYEGRFGSPESTTGRLQGIEWTRENGGSFHREKILGWRHLIPELAERFKQEHQRSPGTSLETFCSALRATPNEIEQVRRRLWDEDEAGP